jgi:hypothetical protein
MQQILLAILENRNVLIAKQSKIETPMQQSISRNSHFKIKTYGYLAPLELRGEPRTCSQKRGMN